MGGGGGDDGYEKRQQDIEAKKQRARDLLNAQFGVSGGAAPDRAKFMRSVQRTTPVGPDPVGNSGYDPSGGLPQTGSGFTPFAAPSGQPEGGGSGFGEPNYGTDQVFDQSAFDDAQAQFEQARANGSSRDALYQSVRDNAFTSGKRKLDEQKGDAGRKLKFELFARGLNGGSEDINQNALLGRKYQEGVMDLGAKADSASAGFRGDDENTRLQLLQAIDSGTDQGSAISSAMNSMKVNADRAAAEAAGTAAGDLFSTGSLLYNKGQMAQGRQAGTEWWNNLGAPNGGRRGGSGATGTMTRLPGE